MVLEDYPKRTAKQVIAKNVKCEKGKNTNNRLILIVLKRGVCLCVRDLLFVCVCCGLNVVSPKNIH